MEEEVRSDASSPEAVEVARLKPTTTKAGRVTKQPKLYEPDFIPTDRGRVARTLFPPEYDARHPARSSREAPETAQATKSTTPNARDIVTLLTALNDTINKQHQTIQAQNDTINSLRVEMNSTVTSLKASVDDTMVVLRSDLATANKLVATVNGKLDNAERERDELKEKVDKLATTINTMGSDILLTKAALTSLSASSTAVFTDPANAASPPISYASALARSINPSSSATQPKATSSSTGLASTTPPGITIDTSRMRDKNESIFSNTNETERKIQEAITAQSATKDVKIKGIQVRDRNIRVLTGAERDAALLRVNDGWVNRLFEGARSRGEDWYPVKIDDAVRTAVVKEDGFSVRDDFAQSFCEVNGFTGIKKAYWLSKGNKRTGSMVVHLPSAEEANRAINERMVKIGGQIAFVSEYHKMARPTRCYNCNQYGHVRARCSNPTLCGKCSGGHNSDDCIGTEKRCPACNGPHTVMDPGCPVYLREKANLSRANASGGLSIHSHA